MCEVLKWNTIKQLSDYVRSFKMEQVKQISDYVRSFNTEHNKTAV
jgi:hypothetical protein